MASGGGFAFGPFTLDVSSERLFRDGKPILLTAPQFRVLRVLVERAGEAIEKDALVTAGWKGAFIGDNNLVQTVLRIRRVLDPRHPHRFIETVPRVGYRFVGTVERQTPRRTDADIDALLAPHRAALAGRAALETLQIDRVARARSTYEELLARRDDDPRSHVGLATACLEQFEATRADATPDVDALRRAASHAREAVRLDGNYAEAWATLGLVLERTGDRTNALAAFRQAVTLEPNEWTHHLRVAWSGWGRGPLSAATRVLELMPGSPAAHWLSSTVYVARNALRKAERELDAGIATMGRPAGGSEAFPPIALHWLKGLLLLTRGADDDALASFERELAIDGGGHIYARETAANTWYAIGACERRRGNEAAARHAFEQALERVRTHAMARAGLDLLSPRRRKATADETGSMERALARAAVLVADDDAAGAARLVSAVLRAASPGHAGWTIPIDPLLGVQKDRETWADVLAELRGRAT